MLDFDGDAPGPGATPITASADARPVQRNQFSAAEGLLPMNEVPDGMTGQELRGCASAHPAACSRLESGRSRRPARCMPVGAWRYMNSAPTASAQETVGGLQHHEGCVARSARSSWLLAGLVRRDLSLTETEEGDGD